MRRSATLRALRSWTLSANERQGLGCDQRDDVVKKRYDDEECAAGREADVRGRANADALDETADDAELKDHAHDAESGEEIAGF